MGLLSRLGVLLIALPPLAFAQLPIPDLRNLDSSHTSTPFHWKFLSHRLEDWQLRREAIRKRILSATGLGPLGRREPPRVSRIRVINRARYRIETFLIETLPGFWVGANLYVPASPQPERGRPAVLVPHGHWENGRVEHRPDYSVPAMCINLAAQGYVALSYDMIGYNDTRQIGHSFGETREYQDWAFGPLSLQLWNSLRAMDVLSSHGEVDAARIAVTGASGGGTQTILLAAVDDRVRVAIPAVMVSDAFQGDDRCEMHPGLRVGTNNVEIAAMMAPKPMLLISSSQDWTRHTPDTELPAIRGVYELYGHAAAIENAHIDAKHNYNRLSREAAYRFLAQHLAHRPETGTTAETETFDLPAPALLAGSRKVKRNERGVFESWRRLQLARSAGLPVDARREQLALAAGVEWPATIVGLVEGQRVLLQRPDRGQQVPALWRAGATRDTATLVVHPQGAMKGLRLDAARRAAGDGDTVLAIDVFQRGAAVARRAPPRRDHLTFHGSDDANRVQDIVTGIGLLAADGARSVRMVCSGEATAWCVVAAAAAPFPVSIDERPAPGRFAIPGLAAAGGLSTAMNLASERRPMPAQLALPALSWIPVYSSQGPGF